MTNRELQNLPYTSDVCGDGDYIYFTGTKGMRYLDNTLHVMDTTAIHTLAYSGKFVFSSGPKGELEGCFTEKLKI